MNVRSLIKQHGDHLKSNRSGGESVSVLELMEVCRKWQDYVRKVMVAAARAAEEDVYVVVTIERAQLT